MFREVHGGTWFAYIIGSFVVSGVIIALLQLVPQRYRRHLILTLTFLGGLFFALEFFLPTHRAPTKEDKDHVENFLTQYVIPFGNLTPVITAWSVGLGLVNLFQVHGKRVVKGASGSFNSIVFFISTVVMFLVVLLAKIHPNSINKNLNTLLMDGGLASLDATMFSIVAFYIVSAAYRAFRVRSVEATMLLVTAVVVMLGQIAVGQFLTQALPHNMHFEVIRDWILTKANAPATRAIAFGLGIGSLAVSLRIWLGLERGSYFERQ